MSRMMHLATFTSGTGMHAGGWRLPGSSTSNEDIDAFVRMAQTAERGRFDIVFVADNLAASKNDSPSVIARLEPFAVLSALSMATERIGLVGTASTTYSEPYNVARKLASLDHISHGRAGWNIVTTFTPEAAGNFGREAPVEHDLRYEMAAEYVEVVKRLWDSWEDGARIADRETGRYMDSDLLHPVDFEGRFFKIHGQLNGTRPPQGHPVFVQAGSSPAGQNFAAGVVEVMFTVQQDLNAARRFYTQMKDRVAAAGRDQASCKILPGILPIVGRTDEEAQRKLAELMRFVYDSKAAELLSHRFGRDMSAYPLDGPVPDLPPSEIIQSFAKVLQEIGRRPGTTLRDIYNNLAVARGYLPICGSPQTVANVLQEWFAEGAADGFVVISASVPSSLEDFVDLVVPELRARGLFRTEYSGSTLREHLGLQRPEHPAAGSGQHIMNNAAV